LHLLAVVSPPKASPAVLVPEPAKPTLAIFKLFTSVQLVPFQISVFKADTVVYPPKANAAVLVT
jgi:hypothetical protein